MNDAKGCFDRIQHTFAVLVLMHYRVALLVATTLFEVQQKALCLDWANHTKETLPGDISLPDKNGELYTVTRDEPTSAHTSLGIKIYTRRWPGS